MRWIRSRLCKWLGIWDLEYRYDSMRQTIRLQNEWILKLQTKVHKLEKADAP